MGNGLSGIFTAVGHYSIARLVDTVCLGYLCDSLITVGNHLGGFIRGYIVERSDMAFGNKEVVCGCSRIYVGECEDSVILIDLGGWDVSIYDFAEKAIGIKLAHF